MGTSRAITQPLPSRGALFKVLLRGVLAKHRKWRRTRRAERELLALDNRLLRDIGLCRTEIPNAVRGEPRKVYELAAGQQL